jgi:acetoin utilization protein AcuB
MNQYVYELMSYPVTIIHPEASLAAAKELMEIEGVRQLPVLSADNQLIGIISDRDIREVAHTELFDRALVGELMTSSVITIKPDISAERAAHILHREKIGALPVVEKGELVGILTVSDILEAFSSDGWQSSVILTSLRD